jgi:hypothetical protein
MTDGAKPETPKPAIPADLESLQRELLRKDFQIETGKLHSEVRRLSDIVKIGLPTAFALVLACLAVFFGVTQENIHEKVDVAIAKITESKAIQAAVVETSKAASEAKAIAERAKNDGNAIGAILSEVKKYQDNLVKMPKVQAKAISLVHNLDSLVSTPEIVPFTEGDAVLGITWAIQDNAHLQQYLEITGVDTPEPTISGNTVKVKLKMKSHHNESVRILWTVFYQ